MGGGCSTPRFTSEGKKTWCAKVQKAGWKLGLVWTGAKIVAPTGIQSPD